jgi:hypothetical protein
LIRPTYSKTQNEKEKEQTDWSASDWFTWSNGQQATNTAEKKQSQI